MNKLIITVEETYSGYLLRFNETWKDVTKESLDHFETKGPGIIRDIVDMRLKDLVERWEIEKEKKP